MRDEAERRIGHLYPKVKAPGGTEHTVIAWKWARTVTSPNPANPIEVPLVNSWWLSKKKGKEAWIRATVRDGQVHYEVVHDANGPRGDDDWTIRSGKARKQSVMARHSITTMCALKESVDVLVVICLQLLQKREMGIRSEFTYPRLTSNGMPPILSVR